MTYTAHNYDHLLGLEGLSDESVKTHLGLYAGYVTNTNAALEELEVLEAGSRTYNDVSRRFAWEFNGMRLHEVYFGVMSHEPGAFDESSELGQKIISQFGSYDAWEADFRAKANIRGIGWGILAYDTQGDKLLNIWISEHDQGHLATTKPLIAVDVFEHAFFIDYGTDRGSYVDTFMRALDWRAVEKNFL